MVNDKKLIFVCGTGRSGTHLIGRTIASHPKIRGRIEADSTFKLITKLATTQDLNNIIYNQLLKWQLKLQLKRVISKSKLHVLEKSHPSLWLMDFLMNNFSNSKFIIVHRDVEPVVNSMLNHTGVLSWYNRLPLNKPNRFLGITKQNKESFSEFLLEKKCTLRWLSHYNEMIDIKKRYPNNTFVIKYENLLKNPTITLSELAEFLNLSNEFSPEEFNMSSLNQWKERLSYSQLKTIRNTLKH